MRQRAGGLYPNPADEFVLVEEGSEQPSKQASSQPGFRVELYNGRGQLLWHTQAREVPVRIPTARLQPGLYHVVVTRGNRQEHHNLHVQH